jgi:hypothetical protein
MAGVDPFADLAKKIEILEREMATQREALERLKALGAPPQARRSAQDVQVRRTA